MSRGKSLTRIYFPGDIAAHGMCVVPPAQSHHAQHVLRLEPNDAIVLFDGRGHEYPATIERFSKAGMTLNVEAGRAVNRESSLEVTLAQGISSGERMDYTIQKAVELGVQTIQPLATERSVVRLSAERAARRIAHWQGVAIAACEQSGRNRIPEVMPVVALTSWLASTQPIDSIRLSLAPDGSTRLRNLERPAAEVLLLVGPEGGFSPRERDDAAAAGFVPIRLGPRILRTETAAVAAVAAMQMLWGDF